MTKIVSTGFLFATLALFAACGGSSKKTAQPEASDEDMTPVEDMPTAEVAPRPDPEPEVAMPAPPPAPPAPKPVLALANLSAIKGGAAMGSLSFELGDNGQITIAGQFNGLTKGKHALYIHEGNCGNDGKDVGGHLNPTKAKHGPPASSTRHAGDFGNVEADADGNATFSMMTDSLTLSTEPRPDSVVDRAVVIHAKADDKKGSGGPVVACGMIAMQE